MTDWKDNILTKIVSLYGQSEEESVVEGLARLLAILDLEDKEYDGRNEESPIWRSLRAASTSDNLFLSYSKRLIEDAKIGEKDASFRKVMADVYERMLSVSEEEMDEETVQYFDMVQAKDVSVRHVAVMGGFAAAWDMIPMATRDVMLVTIKKFALSRSALLALDDAVGLVNQAGGAVVAVGLAALILGYEAIKNMKRWWAGEISGKRCSKNIVDALASSAAGVGGGFVGAALGSLLLPGWGTLVGGIAGSIGFAQGASILSDRITQAIFGLPKSEALENAYNYFGVESRASNHEINQKFRALCLQHHPDKGGKAEDFHDVQYHMGLIKLARGEM